MKRKKRNGEVREMWVGVMKAAGWGGAGVYMINFLVSPEKLSCVALTPTVANTKRVEFANSLDADGVALNELPYLALHCVPSSL